MKLDPVLLEILVCPDCKSALRPDDAHDELICTGCGLIYPVRDDIPVMLVEEARRESSADESTHDPAVSDTASQMIPGTAEPPSEGTPGEDG